MHEIKLSLIECWGHYKKYPRFTKIWGVFRVEKILDFLDYGGKMGKNFLHYGVFVKHGEQAYVFLFTLECQHRALTTTKA